MMIHVSAGLPFYYAAVLVGALVMGLVAVPGTRRVSLKVRFKSIRAKLTIHKSR